MQSRYAIRLIAAAGLVCGRPASAQYLASTGLHRAGALQTARYAVLAPEFAANGSRLVGAAHGALIGAGVGAGVGLVVVVVSPHSDHSEDAIGPIVGAFFGLLLGTAIGSAHPR